MLSGTEGYAEEAPDLVARYESIKAEAVHELVLHLIPRPPRRVAEIGAGTGRDAAWLAGMGHSVVAVEPTAPMRDAAMRLHPSPAIEWLDDGLPALSLLRQRGKFDLVMMTAVWMHLDAEQRRQAMPNVQAVLAPGGALLMLLRHGPIPEGRRMFEVTAAETIALAAPLILLLNKKRDALSAFARGGAVTWTQLAFRAPA